MHQVGVTRSLYCPKPLYWGRIVKRRPGNPERSNEPYTRLDRGLATFVAQCLFPEEFFGRYGNFLHTFPEDVRKEPPTKAGLNVFRTAYISGNAASKQLRHFAEQLNAAFQEARLYDKALSSIAGAARQSRLLRHGESPPQTVSAVLEQLATQADKTSLHRALTALFKDVLKEAPRIRLNVRLFVLASQILANRTPQRHSA